MTTIVVLDYGIGNVRSISNALKIAGANVELTDKPERIREASGVILPGVGAFSQGMKNLKTHGLVDIIHDYVKSGKMFLGICLGMQMLLDESDEFGTTSGLGLIEGKVSKLRVGDIRLPHVSWNQISPPQGKSWNGTIFGEISPGEDMYFVHSYAAYPKNSEHILSETTYGGFKYCSAVHRDNVYGAQFHPEKSATEGLEILKAFIKMT